MIIVWTFLFWLVGRLWQDFFQKMNVFVAFIYIAFWKDRISHFLCLVIWGIEMNRFCPTTLTWKSLRMHVAKTWPVLLHIFLEAAFYKQAWSKGEAKKAS